MMTEVTKSWLWNVIFIERHCRLGDRQVGK